MFVLQEFNMEIKDKKGRKNVIIDHLSCLVNEEVTCKEKDIQETFQMKSFYLFIKDPNLLIWLISKLLELFLNILNGN